MTTIYVSMKAANLQGAKPALLVLAAGMGSRYGGLKQIEPVGPNGETIIDYSIYDALRAGFGKVVFVIRGAIEAPFKEYIGKRFESRLPIEYVFQELPNLPAGFSAPAGRKKPWGTGHAVLSSRGVIDKPFGVINADDFYGENSFQLVARQLQSGGPEYAMVGFILRNTLSEFGPVARGICATGARDFLEQVTEMTNIEKADGGIRQTDSTGKVHRLTGSEIVSLNMWGFMPTIFEQLEEEMKAFLTLKLQDEKAEFYIPTAVNSLMASGQARVKVLHTPDSWFGVTYQDDRKRVIEGIRALIREGRYPAKLWK